MPENPRIYGLSGYFIGCDNLVNHFATTYKVISSYFIGMIIEHNVFTPFVALFVTND